MASSKLMALGLIVVAVVAFAAGYFFAGGTKGEVKKETTWDIIKKRGYIVVATSPDWPPFEFIDPKTNKLVGYEVDLMEAVAAKLGIKVKWKHMNFDSIISAVKNKEVDLGVSGFSVTPKRLEEVLFTMPHVVTEVQLITTVEKAKSLGIDKLKSLDEIAKYKMVVGTGSGTTEEDELMKLVKEGKVPSDLVRSFQDFELALEALKKGDIDAVYAETPVTTWWISTEKTPLTVIYRRSYWPVAWVAHKDSAELVKHLDGALAELFAEGKIDQIRAKWGVTSG